GRVTSVAEEVCHVHAQHARNAQQAPDASLRSPGLDLLIGGPGDARRKVHGLLGAVLSYADDADAVADGALLLQEPGVVIGQVRHSTNARPIMIISQPGLPGIM